MKEPIKIAVSGAAGQISYSLLFRLASGDMLGLDQPIILQLLEIEPAMASLNGIIMELNDCAFPLLYKISTHTDPYNAFEDADIVFLVGSRPRSKGMERGDLLEANGAIFTLQGKALAKAKPEVKVLVVGNPANTNALIALNNTTIDPKNITAMVRLDHNRAVYQLAQKTNVLVSQIKNVIVWGNHSATQYPDISHALVNNIAANTLVDSDYLTTDFMPTVQKRGASIIEARGLSSAASAANAAINHMRDWVLGSQDWVSMAVASDGSYGIPEGIVYGFPVICQNGNYEIIKNLEISDFSRKYMDITLQELLAERDTIKHLL